MDEITVSSSLLNCFSRSILDVLQVLNGMQNGATSYVNGKSAASVTLPDGSCVVRRKVDDDNSCLFSAVAYVMEGSRAQAQKLRWVTILSMFFSPIV